MSRDQALFPQQVLFEETPHFALRKKRREGSLAFIIGSREGLLTVRRKGREASFAVEAAVSFSIFMCIVVTALMYMRLITVQYEIKGAMTEVVRDAAAYGDFLSFPGTGNGDGAGSGKAENGNVDTGDSEGLGKGTGREALSEIAMRGLLEARVKNKIRSKSTAIRYVNGGLAGLSFSGSTVTDTDIDMHCTFTMNVIGDFISKKFFTVHETAYARRYVGWDPSMEEMDEYVYVTPNGTAYHRDVNCHYLDLSIRSIGADAVSGARNKSGAKYYECESCHKKGSTYYYVTDYGTSYHSSLDCSGLKRTVRRVPYESVKDKYHACAKCGGEN